MYVLSKLVSIIAISQDRATTFSCLTHALDASVTRRPFADLRSSVTVSPRGEVHLIVNQRYTVKEFDALLFGLPFGLLAYMYSPG